MQEKLAEAILKESQSSSEPELSDTSTEEEEVSVDKGPDKENKGTKLLTLLINYPEKKLDLFLQLKMGLIRTEFCTYLD